MRPRLPRFPAVRKGLVNDHYGGILMLSYRRTNPVLSAWSQMCKKKKKTCSRHTKKSVRGNGGRQVLGSCSRNASGPVQRCPEPGSWRGEGGGSSRRLFPSFRSAPSTLRMGCVLRPWSRPEQGRKERHSPSRAPLPRLAPELWHMTSLGCKGEWEVGFLD